MQNCDEINEALISVVMSVYNGEKYLKEAIDSVLDQTFKNFEFIILDDGSTDSTEDIIKNYKDTRIKLYKNSHNLGLNGSLNRGLSLATGKYIARMDADDVSLPTRFEKQVHYMEENKDVVLCGGQIDEIVDGKVQPHGMRVPVDDENIRLMMLFHNPFMHPTMMIRREILEKNNLKYENGYIDDYDLWIRCMKYGKLANLSDVVLNYRIHENNFSKINQDTHIVRAEHELRNSYISSLPLTDSNKVILRHAFEGKLDIKAKLQELESVVIKYCNLCNADKDNAVASHILSEYMYQFCKAKSCQGIDVFIGYSKLDKCFGDVALKEKIRLALKCLCKGRIHKINIGSFGK